jgi:hypothetical protein
MKLNKIPFFKDKKQLFAFLIENKMELEWEKMSTIKHADAVPFDSLLFSGEESNYMNKASSGKVSTKDLLEQESLDVKAVINTTNLLDSHNDVHLKGIWHKSLKENGKRLKHLQEHINSFKTIIANGADLKAYTEIIAWKELGYSYKGDTQALIFQSKVRKNRNPYMHEQYAMGHVDNHSVGMQHVKFSLAINDEKYETEFANWEKYYPEIANNEAADMKGFFWAVKEAKVREGSAVPDGSNFATPTLETKFKPGDHWTATRAMSRETTQAKLITAT